MTKIDRTGEHKDNVDGLEMQIVEYKNNKEIQVYFPELDILRKTSYKQFKSGKVYPTWKNKKTKIADDKQQYTDDLQELGNNKAVAAVLSFGLLFIISAAIAGVVYSITLLFG